MLTSGSPSYRPIDEWLVQEYIDLDAYAALPAIDPSVPLPIDETLPAVLNSVFLDLHEEFRLLWRPRKRLDAMVQKVRKDLGLQSQRFHPPPRGHVLGLVDG
jgi:hypothetical protein